MKKSNTLYKRAKDLFPAGVNSPVRAYAPYPIFIAKGKGSKLFDVENKSYIDYCLGYGPLILGHANPKVRDSIIKTLKNGWLFGTPSSQELDLGGVLKESVSNLEMMRFTNSGTEATMHSIRLARAYTKKKKILKILGAYHGAHDSVLVKAGSGATTIPSSPGVPEEVVNNTLLANFNDFADLENVIKNNKNQIAGMIIEPVLGNIGVIPPVNGYIKYVREITEENEILLIFDEVITGFRERYGSLQDFYHINADLITLGKIVGGGLPIGVFGGKSEIMSRIAPQGDVYQAGTFSGNPVSMAAGITTLKLLKLKNYEKLNSMTDKLVNTVKKIADESNVKINHFGTMFQIFFNKDQVRDYHSAINSDSKLYFKMFQYFLKNGIYLAPNQFETNFLSFSHTEKDIQKTVQVFEKFINE